MLRSQLIVSVCAFIIGVGSATSLLMPSNVFAQCGGCSSTDSCGDPVWTCVAQDNGSGTVHAPTFTCAFTGGRFVIRSGLPAGSTIECQSFLDTFHDICPLPNCVEELTYPPPPGWSLNAANGKIILWMQGTGALANFQRTLAIPVRVVVHLAPFMPGDPVQSFDTEMIAMTGQLPVGDPDFDLLQITAGGGHGMPSPGHTTLTRLPGIPIPANSVYWAVDSFFDITYRIDFVGAPGGALDGMSGSTQGEPPAHAKSGAALPLALNNKHNSADTPAPNLPITAGPNVADGCGAKHLCITEGLPPGSELRVETEIIPLSLVGVNPPGSLGGPSYTLQCESLLNVTGTGAFAGYQRTFTLPHLLECHVGPIDPAADVQELPNTIWAMPMQLPPGDPDFDMLRISSGNVFGLPSPGHTTLTRMPDGNTWAVDSFFDIAYEIEFVGAPAGPFGGLQGTTPGMIRMVQGGPLPRYTVNAFGLPHTELGVCRLLEEEGIWFANDIGSSGQDGVEISMGWWGHCNGWCGAVIAEQMPVGVRGWSGELDFGPAGALLPGCRVVIDVTASEEVWNFPAYSVMVEEVGGLAAIAVDTSLLPLQPVLRVTAMLNGVEMASEDFAPPYPPHLAITDLGSSPDGGVILLMDKAQLVDLILKDRRASFSASIGPVGQAVSADQLRITSIDPPPAGTPTEMTSVRIRGQNVPNNSIRILDEGVLHRDTYCVQYRESEWDFLTRLSGIGDVDLDGRADLVVSDFDSTGTNGVQFFNPCCDPFLWPFGPPPPDSRMGVNMLVLDTADGSLPPNARLTARCTVTDADGDTGSALIEIARCPGGSCTDGDLLTFDFSELGGAFCEFDVFLGGQAVHSETTPLVYQIWCKIKKELAVEMERRSGGFLNGEDGGPAPIQPRAILKLTEPVEFMPAPGMMILGDEIRFTRVGTGVDIYGLIDLQITGANICDLAITDVEAGPIPVPCPADIAPPGSGDGTVGVPDLLAVINAWGPCLPGAPCPADVAPPGGNGSVGVPDLLFIINNWGPCDG